MATLEFIRDPPDKSASSLQLEERANSLVDSTESIDEILSGARLGKDVTFRGRQNSKVTISPACAVFRQILRCEDDSPLAPGIPNRELLHAVVGLYDICLVDMTPDLLYYNVCDPKSKTILLLRDSKEMFAMIGAGDNEQNMAGSPTEHQELLKELEEKVEEDKDVFLGEETPPATFAECFSDMGEDQEEESDDEDDDEDMTRGCHTFIKHSCVRRKLRKHGSSETRSVGAESRLVAAATFSKRYMKGGEKIIHLMLMAVRPRFRKMGIGKYMVDLIKDAMVTGNHDAVVVHAENSALDFFRKHGFDDDLILNSKWSEIADKYTNCCMLTYLPAYAGHTTVSAPLPELDLIAMDKDLEKWRKKSLEACQMEYYMVKRLRQEVDHLRTQLAHRDKLINTLIRDNRIMLSEKEAIEKQLHAIKFHTGDLNNEKLVKQESDPSVKDSQVCVQDLIDQLEEALGDKRSYASSDVASDHGNFRVQEQVSTEPYDHGKDAEEFYRITKDFYEALRKDDMAESLYEVKMISKAILPSDVEAAITSCFRCLADPARVTRLYYCASLTTQQQVDTILHQGFSIKDFSQGDYGCGLYFSKYPSKAIRFSGLGKLILAEVGVGKEEVVVDKDATRQKPAEGFDSITVPGRLQPANEFDVVFCQEYVIFNPLQVKPLCAIDFTPIAMG